MKRYARGLLHFIAVLPPEAIQAEVTAFKKECSQRFGASYALKSPPHITLVPPFPCEEKSLFFIKKSLHDFSLQQFPFEVKLQGFAAFPPRVIFVHVCENEILADLQKKLCIHLEQTTTWRDERTMRFHPHVTIAHRDLERQMFPEAFAYFSAITYQREFPVNAITLLQHTGGRWDVAEHFEFPSTC